MHRTMEIWGKSGVPHYFVLLGRECAAHCWQRPLTVSLKQTTAEPEHTKKALSTPHALFGPWATRTTGRNDPPLSTQLALPTTPDPTSAATAAPRCSADSLRHTQCALHSHSSKLVRQASLVARPLPSSYPSDTMANMHTDLPALYGVLEPLNPLYRDLLRGVAEFERSGIFGEWNKAYPHPERSFGGAVDKVFEPGADPRTAQWPMVGAPALPLTIVFTYLVGIALASYFVRAVGFPKLKLTPLVFLHNLVCALLSVYMVWETALAFHELYDFRRLLDPQRMWCFPLDGIDAGRGKWESPAAHRLASIIYFHFLTKILELGDTCIMVFKQNWNQVRGEAGGANSWLRGRGVLLHPMPRTDTPACPRTRRSPSCTSTTTQVSSSRGFCS